MNTDLRKKVFVTVMASADYLDAFEKLLKLKLKAKQDREMVNVIVDCCLQVRRGVHRQNHRWRRRLLTGQRSGRRKRTTRFTGTSCSSCASTARTTR